MDPKKFRSKVGPEAIIQRKSIAYLKQRGWHVERMIGNQLQKGIPDVYLMHPKHGCRWVDYKNPHDYEFTSAQKWKWPIWEKNGAGIWILTGWKDEDYGVLFGPPNWRKYWKPRYDEDRLELEQDMKDLFDDET